MKYIHYNYAKLNAISRATSKVVYTLDKKLKIKQADRIQIEISDYVGDYVDVVHENIVIHLRVERFNENINEIC